MKELVDWMRAHRMINIMTIVTYYVLVVAPHEIFGSFLNNTVVRGLGINNDTVEGRQVYNLYVISIAIALLGILLFYFIKHTRRQADKYLLWAYMLLTVVIATLIVQYLFVVNIEFIHFPQYAVCAALLFPLVGNYKSTLIWTTLAGMVDEAYQHFYLTFSLKSYYDFNDVIINLIGGVFGLLLLRSMYVSEHSRFRLLRSSFWYGIGMIIVLVGGAYITGYLSIYPSDVHPYHIVGKISDTFWSKVSPNVTYHIVRPVEGIFMTIGLWVIYGRMTPR